MTFDKLITRWLGPRAARLEKHAKGPFDLSSHIKLMGLKVAGWATAPNEAMVVLRVSSGLLTVKLSLICEDNDNKLLNRNLIRKDYSKLNLAMHITCVREFEAFCAAPETEKHRRNEGAFRVAAKKAAASIAWYREEDLLFEDEDLQMVDKSAEDWPATDRLGMAYKKDKNIFFTGTPDRHYLESHVVAKMDLDVPNDKSFLARCCYFGRYYLDYGLDLYCDYSGRLPDLILYGKLMPVVVQYARPTYNILAVVRLKCYHNPLVLIRYKNGNMRLVCSLYSGRPKVKFTNFRSYDILSRETPVIYPVNATEEEARKALNTLLLVNNL